MVYERGRSLRRSPGATRRRHHLRTAPLTSEPSGGAQGQATDIALHAKEILRIRAQLTEIYVDHCKQPEEEADNARDRFEKALERDYYMTAEEAIKFGLVDTIVDRRADLEKKKK